MRPGPVRRRFEAVAGLADQPGSVTMSRVPVRGEMGGERIGEARGGAIGPAGTFTPVRQGNVTVICCPVFPVNLRV